MSHKGYSLEHEIETYFLQIGNQDKNMPFDKRTFRVPFSGMMTSLKGDVRTNCINWLPQQLMIECKDRRTKNKNQGVVFNLELEWLFKLVKEAKAEDRMPVFIFAFKGTKFNRLQAMIHFKNPLFYQNSPRYYPILTKNGVRFVKKELDELYNNSEGYTADLPNNWVLFSWNKFDALLKSIKEKAKK